MHSRQMKVVSATPGLFRGSLVVDSTQLNRLKVRLAEIGRWLRFDGSSFWTDAARRIDCVAGGYFWESRIGD